MASPKDIQKKEKRKIKGPQEVFYGLHFHQQWRIRKVDTKDYKGQQQMPTGDNGNGWQQQMVADENSSKQQLLVEQ